MKFSKILPASILLTGIVLSSSACAQAKDSTPEPSSQPTTEQQIAPTAAPEKTQNDEEGSKQAAAVAQTVNGFYAFLSDPASLPKIKQAGAPLQGRGINAGDDELKALAAALPEGFKYFDTSSPELIKNAYAQILLGSIVMSKGGMKVEVPESSITVTEDKALVNTRMLEMISENGQKLPSSAVGVSSDLNLKKDASGNWLIVADNSIEKAAEQARK